MMWNPLQRQGSVIDAIERMWGARVAEEARFAASRVYADGSPFCKDHRSPTTKSEHKQKSN